MSEQQNIETIQQLYAAFGRGDIAFILDFLTDDVAWNSHLAKDVPWGGDMSGKSNVPTFFETIYSTVDVLGFDPKEFVAQGNTVVSTGTFAAAVKQTGKTGHTPWVFIWKFRDGKICSYEQFTNADFAAIFSH